MRSFFKPRTLFAALVLLSIAALAPWAQQSLQTSAVAGSVQNAGFEDGVLNGLPQSWITAQPIPDAINVVGAEGPAQFPVYTDLGGITVVPYRGDAMLRLGTPRKGNQAQKPGVNAVSQTYTSDSSSLRFAFRLFSTEHSSNRDIFRVDLRTTTGSVGTLSEPLVVSMPDGATRTCTAMPCEFTIDVGANGQVLDTGWREVKIVDVPTGVPLTLTYGAGGAGDSSQPTWAYFDDANSPPVAKFSFTPTEPVEGSFIQFNDQSFDPDAGDSIVAWEWNIDGEISEARNPFSILPDEGTYNASLRVTSSDGTSATISAGQTALDGTEIPGLQIVNAAPVTDALNIETLANTSLPLIARFADPGWTDSHTSAWTVGSAPVVGTLAEDNLPALSTGIATANTIVAADAQGVFTVTDNFGAATTDNFSIDVVADDPQRAEPNDALAGAPTLNAGGSYLSYVQSEGDVDIFEVLMPGGTPLPAGAEVLLSLRGVPADFDLVAISQTPSGPSTARFAQSDFGQTGFEGARFAQSRFAQSRFAQSRFAQSRFAQSRFAQSRFAQSNVPLSGISFSGLNGEEVSGIDISLAELGIANVGGANVQVAGFSANSGLSDETILARTSVSGTRIFAVIAGANGARSTQPYRIQIEVSVPFDLDMALGAEACTKTPIVGSATSGVTVLYDNPAATRTLFVTQRERMRTLYEMDDVAWNAMLADLTALAQHPAVAGEIISLPSAIYDNWDENPCSIAAADAVTGEIFGAIQSRLTGVANIVLVGDDDVVPHKRVPDETIISNERDYALDSFLKPGSPQLASILLGYNLTDDYYVDSVPSSWQGRELYLPDLAIGRLVETPVQIRAAATAFIASNGILNPATGFVSGYDFFQDGADVMAQNLASKLPTTTLINETWTADELRCKLLGETLGTLTGCAIPDIAAVNAHFTHYAALAAGGFGSGDFTDVLTSTDVANAGAGGTPLGGNLIFSMGCHAGLNVPKRASLGPDAGLGLDPALDFAEAMAIQQAIYIASTGFGLGETEGLGGTEKLLALFSEDLMRGNVIAGQALVEAKQRYIGGLAAMTVYDEKSTIQTVYYGLPMYRVVTPTPAPGGGAAAVAAGDVSVTLADGGATVISSPLVREDTPSGSYFTAEDTSATAGRPILPTIIQPLAPSASGPVQGIVLTGTAYTDQSPFDPVIARPTNEWELGASEPATCLPSFWPSQLGAINTLETATGLRQTLVITPAQFRCTSGNAATVTGLLRLHRSLTFELLRCETPGDAPVIHRIVLSGTPGGAALVVRASDDSGITRIVVVRLNAGVGTSTVLPVPGSTSGDFTVDLPGLTEQEELIVQVQDACRVSTSTAKGANFSLVRVDAGPDQPRNNAGANAFPLRIENFNSLVAPVSVLWDFGDGAFLNSTVPAGVIVGTDGAATFTVEHAYAPGAVTPAAATVQVSDAGGGIGTDALSITTPDDGDGIVDAADNCSTVFNPGQQNINGEPMLLPKPVPFYNDATNPAGDNVGDACDGDADGDGVPNAAETAAGLSPFIWDTDGDRINDGTEIACGTDPLVAISNFVGQPDSDNDRLPDTCEAIYGSNPADPDSDNDGSLDGAEVKYWMTDPLSTNTDGDDCTDGREIASVNADRRVNIIDLQQVATQVGSPPPEFRPFDATGDGAINIVDLQFIAARQGNCTPA